MFDKYFLCNIYNLLKKSIINFGLSFGNSLARAYPIHQKVESDVWKQTVIFRFGQKNSSNDNHSKLISQSEHLWIDYKILSFENSKIIDSNWNTIKILIFGC